MVGFYLLFTKPRMDCCEFGSVFGERVPHTYIPVISGVWFGLVCPFFFFEGKGVYI